MDESSLVRRPTGLKGTVLKLKQRTRVAADHATLADRRCNISFLASICHEEAVQDYLPQVLLSNEHQISLRVLHALQGALPGNIHIWREKSSWNSHKVMRRYLTLLAHCLRETLKKRQVVLLVDVNRAHIDRTILLHARRLSLRMCFVPAKMTRWLQPADTALFSRFKAAFRCAWRQSKSKLPLGIVTQQQWLRIACATIQKVLSGNSWHAAFDAVGALGNQNAMSESLCEELGLEKPPRVPRGLPKAEHALVIFPARMKVNVLTWLHFVPKAHLKALTEESQAGSSAAPHALPPAASVAAPKRRVMPATFAPVHTCRGRPVRRLE